jgi:hypothetical protein
MRNVLLAAAATLALALPGAPATAQYFEGSGMAAPQVSADRTQAIAGQSGSWNGHSGDMRRRGARTDVLMNWYGGEWALYNNRTFAPDSSNDWWHDRPDRAYPRWITQNQGCERMWFSGNVLHC